MSQPRGAFRNTPLRVVVIVGGVLLLGGLAIYLTPSGEPSHQGRNLSDLLEKQPHSGRVPSLGDPEYWTMRSGVKAIGTNALPTLVKWIQTPDTSWKQKINSLLNKQRLIAFRFESPQRRWRMAGEGFRILGDKAMPAIPALTRLLETSSVSERSSVMQGRSAFDAILAIADDKKVLLPVIVQSLQKKDNVIRFKAALYIRTQHPDQDKSTGASKVLSEMTRPRGAGALTNTLSRSK